MAVINKIQLADGSTPIMGFNEFECEYMDLGDGYYEPKFFYEALDALEASGQYVFPSDFNFPKEGGWYITKPSNSTGTLYHILFFVYEMGLDYYDGEEVLGYSMFFPDPVYGEQMSDLSGFNGITILSKDGEYAAVLHQ